MRGFTNDLGIEQLTIGYRKDPREALDFIEKNTDYNTGLMWEYMLRTKNLFTLYEQMQLEYVIPANVIERPFLYEKSVAVILHIYYEDQIERMVKYCGNFPDNTDFFITTTKAKNVKIINDAFRELATYRSLTVKVRPNIGLAMSSLWVTYANIISSGKYEYICYFHDKKSPYGKYNAVGEEFADRCFRNIVGSGEIVKNIINLFESNPKMGILAAPEPYHGCYFSNLFNAWTCNYENAKLLADRMGLKASIDSRFPPKAPLGDMFWFRADALKKIAECGLSYSDIHIKEYASDGTKLHAMERLYGYISQDAGYYYAEVINTDDARSDLSNFRYMLSRFLWSLAPAGYIGSFGEALSCVGNRYDKKRISLKRKIKKHISPKVWNFLRNLYHRIGGKKWIG